jgi:hypothetical protein
MARAERERELGEAGRPRFARLAPSDGPSAFERLGAELEALFVGGAPATEPEPESVSPPVDRPVRTLSLGPIEADLTQQLMQEGIVIRGHDVARVVGLMAGVEVAWTDGVAV